MANTLLLVLQALLFMCEDYTFVHKYRERDTLINGLGVLQNISSTEADERISGRVLHTLEFRQKLAFGLIILATNY